MPRKVVLGPRSKSLVIKQHPRQQNSLLSPHSVERMTREFQAMDLRKRGYTYREIGATLDCSETDVSTLLEDVLTRTIKVTQESAEVVRFLESERLDAMMKSIYDLATSGSPGHIDLMLKLMARRAKMLGIDAPEAKEINVSGIRQYVGINIDLV